MTRRLTTSEFIGKAKKVHGDRYDYSSVNYVGAHTKVTIICRDHGPFPQTPGSHIRGVSCPDCAGTKRRTTETFIEKAKEIHGDRYDYSSVNYVNAYTNVTIICPDHGPFPQAPTNHLQGKGCRDCGRIAIGNAIRLTTEEFIEMARAVHGDRYDYSSVNYVNASTKVTVLCRDHGAFEQRPADHLSEKGCPDCGGSKRRTTETFLEKAKAIHGDRYNYSEVEYVNDGTKVTIICPDHGPFPQTPNNHLEGKGCPDCGGTKPLTTEIFIEKAKAIHGERYDYSLVEYVNIDTNVTVICADHGPFEQVPYHHLSKRGCPDCGGSKQLTTEQFIEKAKEIHGDRYDYSSVNYVNASTKVTVLCRDHGAFSPTPNNHLRNRGCPDCADYGFNPNESGTLYYIAVTTDDGDMRYKIGITNNTVEDRFRGPDLARIRIVKTWRYAIGRAAAEREAEILYQYAGDKYYGPKILVGAGNNEIFTHDILGLDR